MVLTLLKSPAAKTDAFVATAAQLGVTVTAKAVEDRFTDTLVGFLRAGLEHVLGHALAADPAAIPLLDKFTAVEIADSTSVTVPDEYADEFPGCGGKSGSGKAVNDRLTRLYSAQQDAVQRSAGWNWICVMFVDQRSLGAGVRRSRKCHRSREGPVPPVHSFSQHQGSMARTVGCPPEPGHRPPRSARSTTSAISED